MDSFFPLGDRRYYRFSTTLPEEAIHRFSSFELYVQHYYSIRVFINGFAFLEQSSRFAPCLIRSVSNDTEIRESIMTALQNIMLAVGAKLQPATRTTVEEVEAREACDA